MYVALLYRYPGTLWEILNKWAVLQSSLGKVCELIINYVFLEAYIFLHVL